MKRQFTVWAKLKGDKKRHIFGYAETLEAATFLAQTCETHGIYGLVNIDDGDETVAFVER